MSAVVAPLVIGVTGHRNIPAREIEPIRQCVRDFLARLQRDFPGLPLLVLSSLAVGGDQLVAEVALGEGARLVVPLPFERDIYTQGFGAADRTRFDALCACSEVLQLPLLHGVTVADIAGHGAARDRQFAQAGVFVASHCHILLALWDGRESDLLGGTAQVVRYHLNGTMAGWIERRHSHRVLLDSGDESLLYHITCSRADREGTSEPPAPLQPTQARWVSQEHVRSAAAGMPEEFRRMFIRMRQFNDDATRYADDMASDAASDGDAASGPNGCVSIDGLFAAADWLAIHFQKQVLRAMRGLYALAALMGIAFVAYSDLPDNLPGQGNAIYVFVLLFAAGVWLAWLARRREWHRKYIDYRALAEGLRVQRYWRCAGIGADDPGAFAHDNFMQKQDVELGWIRNVMRVAGISGTAATTSVGALVEAIADWIGEPGGNGQLGYYVRKAGQRHRIHSRTQRLSRILLIIVIAASVFLAVFHPWIDSDITTYLVAMMGVLTVIAAVRESYAYRKADKELIKQYRYMSGIFTSARRKLDAAPDPRDQRDVLRALGEAALAEHAEWALMHRERPLEHGKL